MGTLFDQLATLSSPIDLEGSNILAILSSAFTMCNLTSKGAVYPSLLCKKVVEAHQVVVILEGVGPLLPDLSIFRSKCIAAGARRRFNNIFIPMDSPVLVGGWHPTLIRSLQQLDLEKGGRGNF